MSSGGPGRSAARAAPSATTPMSSGTHAQRARSRTTRPAPPASALLQSVHAALTGVIMPAAIPTPKATARGTSGILLLSDGDKLAQPLQLRPSDASHPPHVIHGRVGARFHDPTGEHGADSGKPRQ